jgi:hypothetical protein
VKSKLYFYDSGNSNGKMTHKAYIEEVLDPILKPLLDQGLDVVLFEDGDFWPWSWKLQPLKLILSKNARMEEKTRIKALFHTRKTTTRQNSCCKRSFRHSQNHKEKKRPRKPQKPTSQTQLEAKCQKRKSKEQSLGPTQGKLQDPTVFPFECGKNCGQW